MHDWWTKWPDQKFWLEATDREDIGADLHAPQLDESGKDNWRYTLFMGAKPGDIVLHYDGRTEPNGIVGWSVIAGDPRAGQITWGARGSYAREKGIKPHERAGYVIPLSRYQRLPSSVTLARIRALEPTIAAVLADLKRKYGEPLYFPFELSLKRPLRPLQGYAFKLPREFLALFPEFSDLLEMTERAGNVEAAPARNPSWSRDELILALDLYFSNPASLPGKQSQEVIELSRLLNRMGRALEVHGSGDFRNPNGVYMKMMNFRRLDPAYTGRGHVGLTRGNKDEEAVWNEFAHDRSRLAKVAAAIRAAVEQDAAELAELSIDNEGMEAPEGRVLTRLHRVRERNQKLVEQRKTKALRERGALACEVCEFDYEKRYGKRGSGFIEAHHTRALALLPENGMTKLEDLALVCANCHRMIHAQKPWLSIEELRAILCCLPSP